jgi:protein CMS1
VLSWRTSLFLVRTKSFLDNDANLIVLARTVRDSTSWTEPRITDNLSAFLKKQCMTLEPTPKKPVGAPHTIVVTASGIRAADLCRSLKTGLPKQGTKDPNVAKLFAKHMKLAEQVAHLKKNKYVIKS